MFKDNDLKKNIILITYAGIILTVVMNLNKVIGFISYIWQLVIPFLIGFCIAFILSIVTKYFERTIFKDTGNKRICSFILTLVLFITLVILLCFIIGPELVYSIKEIVKLAPKAYDKLIIFLQENRNIMNGSFKHVIDSIISLDIDLATVYEHVMKNWQSLFTSGFSIISNTISGIYSFFIGLIFSIYLLFSKETLLRQIKKTCNVLLGKKKTNRLVHVVKLASNTFSSFITCQCLEACILGGMFVISMTILGMPYPLLMGIIIAFTALIPVFGAFIGCFIGIIMISIVNPVQALGFIVLFLVLQQIEGNFIYPHVVGNSVGLPSIWVFVAVIIGGNVMGIVGMFIFIPITSIIYTLFKAYINDKKDQA